MHFVAAPSETRRDNDHVARFKLVLEYSGTRYSGWQRQKNARTVQGELERAIAETLEDDDFDCQGSGRTDAGVHALMQVAHLEARMPTPLEVFRRRVNDALPSDIHVLSISKAPHRFHARHAAVGRTYLYQIARRRTAFAKPYVWWVKEPLDVTRVAPDARAHRLQSRPARTPDFQHRPCAPEREHTRDPDGRRHSHSDDDGCQVLHAGVTP